MLTWGFWMFTNQTIFNNKAAPKNYSYDISNSVERQQAFNFNAKFLAAAPLFAMVFIVIFHRFMFRYGRIVFSYCGCMEEQSILDEMKDKIVDEKSAPFFSSLAGTTQKKWFTRETYFRNILNVKLLDDEQYELLRTSKRVNKKIQGAPNYDIFSQLAYQDSMFYLPIDERVESNESDLVVWILTLGEMRFKDNNQSLMANLKDWISKEYLNLQVDHSEIKEKVNKIAKFLQQ